MFTAEGELRDEFSHLSSAEGVPEPAPPSEPLAPPRHEPRRSEPAERGPIAHQAPETGGPSFHDLIGLLAEPASVYLREAQGAHGLGPGQASQHLELARLHIDLLAVLKDKTAGNLAAQEQALLDDVIFRLRSTYAGLAR